MDTILVGVIVLVLIVVSTLIITVSAFQSINNVSTAWNEMEEQSSSISETSIDASITGNYSGGLINVEVQNNGRTNLYNFPNWDIIIQYQSGNASHLSYIDTYPPSSGQWTVTGIYMADASPEVFDPGILNPEEEMNVAISPDSEIGIGETARIIVSTPNGVTSQCFVTK